jgi:hypothetical protein
MKLLRGGLVTGLSVASLAVSSPQGIAATLSAVNPDGTPQLLTQLSFDSGGASGLASSALGLSNLGLPGWAFSTLRGGTLGLESTLSPTSSGVNVNALRGTYPVPGAGGQFVVASYNLSSLQTEDVYIEFWAKMPGTKGGCKFLKIFSDRPTAMNYANMTFFTNYNGGDFGSIYQVIFGDGTGITNDGQRAINLNGSNPQAIGRSYGTANVLTPQMTAFTSANWGTQWHHFRVHVKFNSGTSAATEVPDGEVYLEIDGNVYVDATGLFNRNPVNGPIHNIELFGWAQNDPQPFEVWYDDVRISTGGFLSQPLPDPPANVAASLPGSG